MTCSFRFSIAGLIASDWQNCCRGYSLSISDRQALPARQQQSHRFLAGFVSQTDPSQERQSWKMIFSRGDLLMLGACALALTLRRPISASPGRARSRTRSSPATGRKMIVLPSRSLELDRAGRRWVKFEKCRWNLEYALSASTENISGGTHACVQLVF